MNERQANRAFALARRIWQANSRPAYRLGRHFVSFHWCTAVMTFIYLIAAGALVWGERRWVDTVFLILMLIIYAVVSETYGYLTSRNRLVPRPVTLRGLLPRAVFILLCYATPFILIMAYT
ncbi:hypothetical protein BLAC_04255 [Bifidobacterium animalis subsp. lactis ATCC 27673]|nr:hypothetical protein BLAC_04255 [Bifidobacterium animalis subsp. lactis ATCC 27673]KOA47589.1 hypothetical protein BAAA27673_02285 [Bifidobacterium animalis subsp. lactis ATCC 27673]